MKKIRVTAIFLLLIFFFQKSIAFAFDIERMCFNVQKNVEKIIANKEILKGLDEVSQKLVTGILSVNPELKKDNSLKKKALKLYKEMGVVDIINQECLRFILYDNNTIFLNSKDIRILHYTCVLKCNAKNFISIVNNEF